MRYLNEEIRGVTPRHILLCLVLFLTPFLALLGWMYHLKTMLQTYPDVAGDFDDSLAVIGALFLGVVVPIASALVLIVFARAKSGILQRPEGGVPSETVPD